MEEVAPSLRHEHVALLSNNSPSVGWVTRMASKSSKVAGMLLRALSLRMRIRRCSPLTPLHLAGRHNCIGDIPSRSFGYKKEWHFNCDKQFLTFFDKTFPLPKQSSWHIFHLRRDICTRVTSAMLTKDSVAAAWKKLPKIGQSSGGTGGAIAGLFEWILTSTQELQGSKNESEPSAGLRQGLEKDIMVGGNKSPWLPYVRRSRPLARRSK